MNDTFLSLIVIIISAFAGALVGSYFAKLKFKVKSVKLEERLSQLQSVELDRNKISDEKPVLDQFYNWTTKPELALRDSIHERKTFPTLNSVYLCLGYIEKHFLH